MTIIGAGLGGLTAGAILARAGLKVCVLEKARRYGGYLAGFDRNGFRFETAIHWLNQCHDEGVVRKVFDFIGPSAPATPPSSCIRRYKSDLTDYVLTDNPDVMRDALIADFPDEERAIRRFFAAARAAGEVFPKLRTVYRDRATMSTLERVRRGAGLLWSGFPLMRYAPCSAEKGFRSRFKSRGLQQTFQAGDRLTSFLVPVGWAYTGDFQQLPRGGSRAFPDWLASVVTGNGGTVSCGCEVQRIGLHGKRATRVVCEQAGESFSVETRYVIAACDLETLYAKLLPADALGEGVRARYRNADIYRSCVTVSLGLDCPLSALGLGGEAVFLTRSDVPREEQHCSDPARSEITMVPYSANDASVAPPGCGVLGISTAADISDHHCWGTRRNGDGTLERGDRYRDTKRVFGDALVKRVEESLAPGLRQHIAHMDIATPVTYHRFTGNRGGAIMGFRPTASNIRSRVAGYRTPVRNLFVGGQWAELGGGVPNTVKAATNSSLLILKKENPELYRSLCDVVDG